MEYVEVVENRKPGRRRHRNMTAKQKKYFGKRRHHRRNPGVLATLAGNPRRHVRRCHHRSNPRHHRRHRNPALLGGFGKMLHFDFRSALEVGGGIAASKYGPQLVQKYIWTGMPTTGFGGYAVRLGVTIVLAQGMKMITKSTRTADNIMLGGLGSIIYDLFTEYAAPAIGLSGYSDRLSLTNVSSVLGDVSALGMYSRPLPVNRISGMSKKYWS
jgi:hypothetical protein